MIIGIAGTLGAGKGTVVEYLKQKGFAHYSGSGKLREILEEKGITPNRETYSTLADEIRGQDPQGLMKLLWQQYEKESPENAVIEALHDVGEAKFILEKGGVILGIDADLETRYARISERGSEKDTVDFNTFSRMAKHEEEGGGQHNIRAVLALADKVILNAASLDELHTAVDEFLAKHK